MSELTCAIISDCNTRLHLDLVSGFSPGLCLGLYVGILGVHFKHILGSGE